MKISVVVPVYNESLGIEEFMKTLQATMDSLTIGWDVLFVDDGSDDDSWQIIERLTRLHPVVRGGIQLLRNFGHQIALSAGLEHADGDAVITMDADLQSSPMDPHASGQMARGMGSGQHRPG
jgi:dolichol-phosphate mannosyltransferase